MKKTKRIVAFALAAVLALLVLAGCKSTLTSIAHKLTGSSDEVQEEDTTQWAVLSSDPLMIDGIADTSAKYATAMANGSLNIVFNGVWSRQTDYFTAPNEKGRWRRRVCGQHHLLLRHRRPELPLRHRQPRPQCQLPTDHLL